MNVVTSSNIESADQSFTAESFTTQAIANRPVANRPATVVAVRNLLFVAAITVSQLVSMGNIGFAADTVPSIRRLPRGTFVWVSITNFTNLKARYALTDTGRLLADPAMQPMIGEAAGVLKKIWERFGTATGLTPGELIGLVDGEVALGMLPTDDGAIGTVLIVDVGSHREELDAVLTKMIAAGELSGMKRITEDPIDGTEITSLEFPRTKAAADTDGENDEGEKADDDDETAAFSMSYFVRDTSLVVATGVTPLGQVLERWNGSAGDPLSESENLQGLAQLLETAEENRDINWYVDITGLTNAGVGQAVAAGQGMIAAAVPGILRQLQVDRLKAIGGTTDLSRSGAFDDCYETIVFIKDGPAGALNLFAFPNISQTPPAWVPATATGYVSLNWDLQKAYTAVESSVDMLQGRGTFGKLIDRFSEREDMGNIHIKKDVIDRLSGMFRMISAPVGSDEKIASLTAIGLNDAPAFLGTIERSMKRFESIIKSRDFQGETIYELGGNESGESRFGFCVHNDQLLIGNNSTLLEEALRGGDREALAGLADYQQIAAHFPEQSAMVNYSNASVEIKDMYNTIRGMKKVPLGGPLGEVDMSVLPEFAEIAKYFASNGAYIQQLESGYRYKWFRVKKAD